MGNVPSKKPNWNAQLKSAGDVSLHHPSNPEERTKVTDLWKDGPVLLIAIRRPGCVMCREYAMDLAEKRKQITEELGIRMVVVCHQVTGAEFFEQNVFNGEVFIDESKFFFKVLGDDNGKERKSNFLQIMNPAVLKRARQAKARGIQGDYEGDKFVLGGILLIDKKGNIRYSYKELTFGDHAPVDTVLFECKKLQQ